MTCLSWIIQVRKQCFTKQIKWTKFDLISTDINLKCISPPILAELLQICNSATKTEHLALWPVTYKQNLNLFFSSYPLQSVFWECRKYSLIRSAHGEGRMEPRIHLCRAVQYRVVARCFCTLGRTSLLQWQGCWALQSKGCWRGRRVVLTTPGVPTPGFYRQAVWDCFCLTPPSR